MPTITKTCASCGSPDIPVEAKECPVCGKAVNEMREITETEALEGLKVRMKLEVQLAITDLQENEVEVAKINLDALENLREKCIEAIPKEGIDEVLKLLRASLYISQEKYKSRERQIVNNRVALEKMWELYDEFLAKK